MENDKTTGIIDEMLTEQEIAEREAREKIPSLPKSWTELNWNDLLYVWQMLGRETPVHEAYIELFQHFMHCHLDTEERGFSDDGQPLYYFISDQMEGVRLSITPSDLFCTCQEDLKWISEDPYCLIELPDDGLDRGDIIIDGLRFHVPEALINSMTYQQYTVCQQLLAVMHDEPSMRHRFVSHCLTPCTGQTETTTGQPLYEYKYSPIVAEANIGFFEQHEIPGLCEVLIQLIQSSLKHYKKEFSSLFSEQSGGGGGKDQSPFITEISTINSVAKWSGMFGSPEAVLDANVPIIFDLLDKMQYEARQIEESNARIKARSHH